MWYRHQETLNRHADYKQSIAQLRDVVLQVLQTRRSEGVQPGDRDLLSFMLRAQLDEPMPMSNSQTRTSSMNCRVLASCVEVVCLC